MTLEFVEAHGKHIARVNELMREEDAYECRILGTNPRASLERALVDCRDTTWTLMEDGLPMQMAGTRPIGKDRATVWLLGAQLSASTAEIMGVYRFALRQLMARHSYIENVAPFGRRSTIAMLRRLGFDFRDAPLHFHGIPFLHFSMTGKSAR